MLIDAYEICVSTPACDLESPVHMARVTLKIGIGKVLPYINATVDRGEFVPGIPVLVWKEGGRKYAMRDREIAISNIADRDEAGELAREIVDRVNATWEERDKIKPSYSSFERPKVLDIFRLLPRTNCKECGAMSCMAFAAMLSKGQAEPQGCPPLTTADCADKLASLREIGL